MWSLRVAARFGAGTLSAALILTACGAARSPENQAPAPSPPPPVPSLSLASTPPQETVAPPVADSSPMVMVPPRDEDGDGLAEDADRCPDAPEDQDGFADDDGCPDPDNDADGVLDMNDRCPHEAETRDGLQDEDGCPESAQPAVGTTPGPAAAGSLAVLGARSIELRQPVIFRTGKADLDPASHAVLDAVAAILARRPSLRIEVGVHSDSAGSSEHNQMLTELRARSVVDYLVRKGTRAPRLTAVGYGEVKPIADNATPEGRAANRRVELLIR